MPEIFNDQGTPSTDPCGFVFGQECDAEQYASWHRVASELGGKLAIIELEGRVAQRAQATAMRAQLKVMPSPSSLSLKLGAVGPTRQVAKLAQRMADLVSQSNVTELPPALLDPPPRPPPPSSGPGFFGGLTTGSLLGIAAVLGGLYYANKKGWLE